MEQAKDIPLVTAESYHQRIAIGSPYTLIPIPEKGSPFPSLNKSYEPGHDKVRIRVDFDILDESDIDPRTRIPIRDPSKRVSLYFLIETFKGEAWKN
jgi:hypothetical protein